MSGDLPARWIVADSADDRKRAAWCSTIGPIATVARNQPGGPVDRLVFVSWNTHVGGGDLHELISRLRDGQLTGAPTPHFVLLLQEVYRAGDEVPRRLPNRVPIPRRIFERPPRGERVGIRELALTEGLDIIYAPEMRNGGESADHAPEDRGNAILSTEPLQDVVVVELPIERQRHVAVLAAVHGTTSNGLHWSIRVANVHLDTAIALTHGGPFSARKRQVEAVIAALQRLDVRAAPNVVVGGDLNTWLGSREPAVQRLRRDFPHAIRAAGSTWRGPLGLPATLDHFFARLPNTSTVFRTTSRFGSDHYALIMSVEL